MTQRAAFFVSDRTGITVEALGHALLTQFDDVAFSETVLPFVDTVEKAYAIAHRINDKAAVDGARPLVFSTLVNPQISAIISSANGLFLDCFEIFILPLEIELGMKSSHTIGRSHARDRFDYVRRIEAVNFALNHDGGIATRDLPEADVILVGVSRCGKTPISLYMAMHYGVRAANFPLNPENFSSMQLPAPLKSVRPKLYGLTIAPERLRQIRSERNPDTAMANCEFEAREAEALMRQEGIPVLDTTNKSIEELATTILQSASLARHAY